MQLYQQKVLIVDHEVHREISNFSFFPVEMPPLACSLGFSSQPIDISGGVAPNICRTKILPLICN